MTWYYWAIILFFIGIIEYALAEYQNLLSVRLKVLQTVLFNEVNLLIDFTVTVFLFLLLFDFWESVRAGAMNFKPLIPYLVYIQGCTIGTGIALLVYRKRKKKHDKEKRLQQLERARRIKKELEDLRSQIITEVDEELVFEDEIQENGNASQTVHNQTKSNQTTSKKQETKESPPQGTGQDPKKA